MNNTKIRRVVSGRVEMIAPHMDGELSHVFRVVGPTIYGNVGKLILSICSLIACPNKCFPYYNYLFLSKETA